VRNIGKRTATQSNATHPVGSIHVYLLRFITSRRPIEKAGLDLKASICIRKIQKYNFILLRITHFNMSDGSRCHADTCMLCSDGFFQFHISDSAQCHASSLFTLMHCRAMPRGTLPTYMRCERTFRPLSHWKLIGTLHAMEINFEINFGIYVN